MNSTSSVPFIPETAPFSKEQRAWLNGFLAGLFSGQNAPQGELPSAASGPEVTICFGSQTGTAESLAKKTAKKLKALNCQPQVRDLAEVSVSDLSSIDHLLLITSTYGEGEPPDNAVAFHKELMEQTEINLSKVNYAILGLGDSNYPDFCQCSRDFDTQLKKLGAKQLFGTLECDGDPDEPFSEWESSLVEAYSNSGTTLPSETEESEEQSLQFDKKNPFPAELLVSENLNGESSAKKTHHVEISLAGSGLEYEVGDALGVYPKNCPDLVDQLIETLELNADELVEGTGEPKSLKSVLIEEKDITSISLPLLQKYVELGEIEGLKPVLKDRAVFSEFTWGKDWLDFFKSHPYVFKGKPSELLNFLKPLSARLYSISSSPRAHPDQVHLTVGKVAYDFGERERKGVCSTYLADRVGDNPVKVFVHSNKAFRLPENDEAPVIMVGPGTGIAPFRAFLEEREARQAKGKNWLFFGDQHIDSDFLYQDQIDKWMKSGLLTRLDIAFSRDQAEKIYVQHRMLEQAEELYRWIEEGAFFYVCGDASRMAKDVDQALVQVIKQQAKLSEEDANLKVQELKKEKRYLRDVY